jgi:hypothetical protein
MNRAVTKPGAIQLGKTRKSVKTWAVTRDCAIAANSSRATTSTSHCRYRLAGSTRRLSDFRSGGLGSCRLTKQVAGNRAMSPARPCKPARRMPVTFKLESIDRVCLNL